METSPAVLAAILEEINDGVYFVDLERRITYWNQAAERISGYTREQVLGHFCQSNILMHINDEGEQLCLGACPLAHTLRDGQHRETAVFLHHVDGHRVPVGVRVKPIFENGQIVGAIEIFTENISLASALSRIQELQKEALIDPLTEIGNRRMLELRLEMAMREWERSGVPFAVLMIDVDHFKRVNDTYGHETGDRVLKMVASSLSSGLRTHDFLGRYGGEEFVAVINEIDAGDLVPTAERLRILVERSVIFQNHEQRQEEAGICVTVSLGGALIQPGESLNSLLARADAGLFRSKESGRNRLTV